MSHEDKPMRIAVLFLMSWPVLGEAPCVSGPRVGQRPGPYSFVLCTGEQRGKSHCYICETADRPAVIVFARSLSAPLGKLTAGLDKARTQYQKNELRGWVTLLHADQSKLDAEVLAWAKKHAVRTTPVGVFEDVDGPPSYKLHRDADVTVLLAVKQKVVANFALRTGELNDKRIAEILQAIGRVTGPAKK
jgi:hypothetical protein